MEFRRLCIKPVKHSNKHFCLSVYYSDTKLSRSYVNNTGFKHQQRSYISLSRGWWIVSQKVLQDSSCNLNKIFFVRVQYWANGIVHFLLIRPAYRTRPIHHACSFFEVEFQRITLWSTSEYSKINSATAPLRFLSTEKDIPPRSFYHYWHQMKNLFDSTILGLIWRFIHLTHSLNVISTYQSILPRSNW